MWKKFKTKKQQIYINTYSKQYGRLINNWTTLFKKFQYILQLKHIHEYRK